jgi:hypothetical protein
MIRLIRRTELSDPLNGPLFGAARADLECIATPLHDKVLEASCPFTPNAKSGNYLTRSITGLSGVGKNSSINRINEKLLAFNSWSAPDIERRQDMLMALARDLWINNRRQ